VYLNIAARLFSNQSGGLGAAGSVSHIGEPHDRWRRAGLFSTRPSSHLAKEKKRKQRDRSVSTAVMATEAIEFWAER